MSDYWGKLEHARNMVSRAEDFIETYRNIGKKRPEEDRSAYVSAAIEYYVVALTYIAYAEKTWECESIRGYRYARGCRQLVESKMIETLLIKD